MYHLADEYNWSKKDISSFSGSEVLQIMYKLRDKKKEMANSEKNLCPMIGMLKGKR